MFSLYDTRLRGVAEISPARHGQLRMYACGPTVYRFAHLGNLRTFLLPDLIRRNAERHKLSVVVCQNITDVGHLADDAEIDPAGEDKILAQARAEGKSALDIARFYEAAFLADCALLNILPPDYAPRASDSIELMIDMIGKLIEAGTPTSLAPARSTSTPAACPTTACCPATGWMSCGLATGSTAAWMRTSGSTPTGRCGRARRAAAS